MSLTSPVVRLALVGMLACAANPPMHWGSGGADLDIPRARWTNGPLTVDVMNDGRVFVNGYEQLRLDRAGRVYDLDNAPIALLESDGRLVGTNNEPLGIVGSDHASEPGEKTAWVTVSDSGEVIRYDSDGERFTFGVWDGCNATPRTKQLCTLITHLVGRRISAYVQEPNVSVGIGVGVGVPIR